MFKFTVLALLLYAAGAGAVEWKFDSAGSFDKWGISGCTKPVFAKGVAEMKLTEDRAMFFTPPLQLDAAASPMVKFRIKLAPGIKTKGCVLFVTDTSPDYSDSKMVLSGDLYDDGQFHDYSVDMSQNPAWKGTITQLRFQPISVGNWPLPEVSRSFALASLNIPDLAVKKSVGAKSANLIPNGSFEQLDAAGNPLHWNKLCDKPLDIDVDEVKKSGNAANSRIHKNGFTGDNAAAVLVDGEKKEVGGWNIRIPVVGGKRYKISCMARVEGGANGIFSVSQLDKEGKRLQPKDIYFSTSLWEKYSMTMEMLPETTQLYVAGVLWRGKGLMEIDDVEVLELDDNIKASEIAAPARAGEMAFEALPEGITLFAPDYLETVYPTTRPKPEEIGATFRLYAAPGEFEPVSFAVLSKGKQNTVSLELSGDFVRDDGVKLPRNILEPAVIGYSGYWFSPFEFRRIPCFVDRLQAKPSLKRIYYEDQVIPEDEALRFWLTAQVPEDAAPGLYRMPIRLLFGDGTEAKASIELEVYPFKLENADASFGSYYQLQQLMPDGKRTREYQKMMFQDMARHGMNTVAIHYYRILEGDLNFANPPYFSFHWTMNDLLASGFTTKHPIGIDQGPLTILEQAVKEKNYPPLLYFTVDEPGHGGKERVEECRKMALEYKKQVPESKLTTSFYHKWALMELADSHDVLIAHVTMIDDEVLALNQKGKEVWSYECVIGSTTPESPRLQYGLYNWALGLKGAMVWVYQTSGSQLVDRKGVRLSASTEKPDGDSDENPWSPKRSPWSRFDQNNRTNYNWHFELTSAGESGPEPVIGYEALREGIDDSRYLATLEHYIRLRENTPAYADKVARAKNWCDQLRRKVDSGKFYRNSPADEYKVRFGWDFSPGIDIDFYNRFRREAAQLIVDLAQ